jgi:hypothetical protein
MTDDFRGPAARRFDWQHILERHSENGVIAQQSGLKTTFTLTDTQIKLRVKAAWRNRSRVRSQFDPLGVERILYRGNCISGQGKINEAISVF